jgi:DNA repair protein RecN (Recombination protein N)
MLRSLRITNYALVDRLEVEFGPGLNVITGATGAGKSIIVGATDLILGERASTEAVRSGCDCAGVEAVFETPNDRTLRELASKAGVTVEDVLLIRREVSGKGQSKCFVNDRQVTLGSLKSIGDRLADLHGQHEHQSLLNVDRHVEYLDQFGHLQDDLSRLGQSYRLLKTGWRRSAKSWRTRRHFTSSPPARTTSSTKPRCPSWNDWESCPRI